ncbi:DeoR/GlpR family DNA-binding transcription regulator [Pontiella sulfatireligans]|uniref:HTH-type transcriptional repressor GlcR n=1 Tax=Pontiella sulfatireligans TaxID=2750658 RepID=A0A6C2USC2_9BACT|nr:DeoR/GlpR family DNA-binding transcription regulator [Pontiella sulfatireligans]VGO23029.1 HTH-type transcriptional repressor GlcR [Pontiella sulfatireligans]
MSNNFSERKAIILELLMEESSVSVSELAKRLKVTVVTARADLVALEEEGLLVRTHGGAVPARHPKIMERSQANKEIKGAVAKVAASMIKDGDTVIITAGTTTALIAKYLLGKRDVHIVTNNTLLLTYARANPQLRVTLIGGEFRPSEEGVVGPMALTAIDQFHVSTAFIGIDGASIKQGFTANSVESADLVRKMAEQADQVIAISDSKKFGKPGFARILPFDGVDALVTDNQLTKEFETELTGANVRIVKS